jgi:hypothetical protein
VVLLVVTTSKKKRGKNWLEKTKTHQKVVVQEAKKGMVVDSMENGQE